MSYPAGMTNARLTQTDIQHISDMRLIAMAKLQEFIARRHSAGQISRLRTVILACEELIAEGPEEFRHITEPCVSVAKARDQLHVSVFGHSRG